MENKLAKYGVMEPVNRPKIKPTKQLDLSTPEGQRLVYSEAKLILWHVSDESEHSFRSNPITHFGFIRSLLAIFRNRCPECRNH